MKRITTLLVVAVALVAAAFAFAKPAGAFEEFNLWPGLAPGETPDAVKPTYEYWAPETKTTDACLVVCPGGAYNGLAYAHEGDKIAKYFTSKGVTVVVLKYRVPRRKGLPKHMAAWQDAQRCVRVVRSRADEWGINPEKIGIMGFSAGGHLTLMVSTTSQTNSYEPIDDVDKLPCMSTSRSRSIPPTSSKTASTARIRTAAWTRLWSTTSHLTKKRRPCALFTETTTSARLWRPSPCTRNCAR